MSEEKQKTAALVLNGTSIPYEFSEDFVVYADRAFNRTPFVPHVLIGDFDSIESPEDMDVPAGVEIVKLQMEKDVTDGEAALDLILERGYKNINIYGLLGGRQDHIMFNLALLGIAYDKGATAVGISGSKRIYYVGAGDFVQENVQGKTVSVVPFSDKVHIMTTEGLYYPLKDEFLFKKSTRGISNRAVEKRIKISVKEGEALIFVFNGR